MKFLAWPSERVQRVLVSTQKTIMELTWLGFFFWTCLPNWLQISPTPAFMVHRSRFCLVSLPFTLLTRYWVTYINGKLMFCTWTCPNVRENGVYRVKDTEQCKFGSVKACKKEKGLTSGWCASLKNAFASATYSFILILPLLTWKSVLCLVNCFTKNFYVLLKHRTILVGLFWVAF